MIILNDNYCIGFDTMNIILYCKTKSASKNYKMFNGNYYNSIGYFGDFISLSNCLIKNHILLNRDKYKSLDDIVNEILRFKEEINSKIEVCISNIPYKYKIN